MKAGFGIALGLLAGILRIPSACAQDSIKDVLLTELTANPAQYDGLTIRVKGFLLVRFENQALYPSANDLQRSRAVWLGSSVDLVNRIRELADRYVVVEGKFTRERHGHLNKFSGELMVTQADPDTQKKTNSRATNNLPGVPALMDQSPSAGLTVKVLLISVTPCLRGGCTA